MTTTIRQLLQNSGLPGPRGNLELLYSFSKGATPAEIEECFTYYADDLYNSPEEFVVMCGIVAFCIHSRDNLAGTLHNIRKYASHRSWRIREAVAIGIQEIAEENLRDIHDNLKLWVNGNALEQRAVVAALCEPKLLKNKEEIIEIFQILTTITRRFESITGKLTDPQKSLRKTLGYGWSVVIVPCRDEGKKIFESIAKSENKHIRWIIKENLKKNRLIRIAKDWVDRLRAQVNS